MDSDTDSDESMTSDEYESLPENASLPEYASLPSSSNSPDEENMTKRRYHNILEQNRRFVLKDSFSDLDLSLQKAEGKRAPGTKGPGRAGILRYSMYHLSKTKKLMPEMKQTIQALKSEVLYLQEQDRLLDEATARGDMERVKVICDRIARVAAKKYSVEKYDYMKYADQSANGDEWSDCSAHPSDDDDQDEEVSSTMETGSDSDQENKDPGQLHFAAAKQSQVSMNAWSDLTWSSL